MSTLSRSETLKLAGRREKTEEKRSFIGVEKNWLQEGEVESISDKPDGCRESEAEISGNSTLI